MKIKHIDTYKFIVECFEKGRAVFSSANGELNFNKNSSEGLKNIEKLKEWFDLKDVIYLNQIHSDLIHCYKAEDEVNFIKLDGDAIITKEKNIAIGIFTADCVPVLIIDKNKEVAAAVHSGWKGTLNLLVYKTIRKMIDEYNCDAKDIIVYIGPHINFCCYEVGEELIKMFTKNEIYGEEVVVNNKLDLTLCIRKQCVQLGVDLQNVVSMNFCTFCSKEKWFSYRKNKTDKRMFSFIVIGN